MLLQTRLRLGLSLGLRLLHVLHGVLAPVGLQTCAARRLRLQLQLRYRRRRVEALGPRRLFGRARLGALPAREKPLQLQVQLGQLVVRSGRVHNGGARLDRLAGLGVLLGVLRQVREVGLQAADVAGPVSWGAWSGEGNGKGGYTLNVLLGWLRLVALGGPNLAALALRL
jgi:hypothetical protein